MKELFDKLPHTRMSETLAHKISYLVDTCFMYFMFEKHEKDFLKFCKSTTVGITSFNVEELLYHSHDVNHTIRTRIRSAIKNNLYLVVVDVDVSPGNPFIEKDFIEKIDPALLNIIPDPSDAVLAAVAKSIHSDILTRDKHHLFTSSLENYFVENGLKVLNNIPQD